MKFSSLLLPLFLTIGCAQHQPHVDLSEIKWIYGSDDCLQNSDPPIQVIHYNATTWILRQNKCVDYEAPFMFLFAGSENALLVDTGATEDSTSFPLYATVRKLLDGFDQQRGRKLNLVVAHSHRHSDHYAGDAQFKDKPNTTLVGVNKKEVVSFFRFTGWPNQNATFDLGDRKLTIIPIPGHDEASIAVYDEQTGLLLSGDTFYPGRLYVRDWPSFISSIDRLNTFCKNNSVTYLVGNHIEMKDIARLDYPIGTVFQPNEHRLPLRPENLQQLHEGLAALGNVPTHKVFDDFIVVPIIQVQEQPIAIEALHTITLPGYPDFLAADSAEVWVTNTNVIQKLAYDKVEPLLTATTPGICGAPVVAFGSVWAASCTEQSVLRIDRTSGKITARIPTGIADPSGELSLAAGAGSVWVVSDTSGVLSRIDPNSNLVIAKIAVKPNTFCATFGYGSVWVTNTNNGTAQRIDPATNQVVAAIAVGPTPRFLAVGEGGIWTLNQGNGTVTRIDPDKNRIEATILCEVPGTGGDIAAGGGQVWVRSKISRMLQSINPKTNTVERIYGPLNGSGAVRVAAGRVWVTAHDVNRVWVLP